MSPPRTARTKALNSETQEWGRQLVAAITRIAPRAGSLEVAKEDVYGGGWESVLEGIRRDVRFDLRIDC